MKSRILGVFVWLFLSEIALAQSQYQGYVNKVLKNLSQELLNCGLNIVQWNPTNPNDNRRAIIVAQDGRYLAWYLETGYGLQANHEFVNYFTGGYVHRITYDNQRLQFVVPNPGIVASITMLNVGGVWQHVMRCRIRVVNSNAEFDQCVEQGFMAPIVQQLCNA